MIQLLSILFLMAFFASFIQLFVFNIILLLSEIEYAQCSVGCVSAHLIKSFLGFISSFLSALLFIKIQLRFIPLVNNTTSDI